MTVFPSKVLLATDGSSDAALAAIGVCGNTGAELHVVHAWRVLPSVAHAGSTLGYHAPAYREESGELLEEQVARVRAAGGTVAGAHLREGRAAEEIADLAEELGADLVVVGSRGIGTVEPLITGSVSEGVVQLAPCPVLVMRGAGT